MKYKNLTKEHKEDFIRNYNSYKEDLATNTEVMKTLADTWSISLKSAYNWLNKISDELEFGPKKPTKKVSILKDVNFDIISDENKKIFKLENENKALNKALKDAKTHIHISDGIKSMISDLNGFKFTKKEIPKWLNNKTKSKIVPVLNIADPHFGETVNPADINYVNEYDSEIGEDRLNRCTDSFIDIYINQMNYEYDGVVLNILGDVITNDLHDLAETNDKTVIDQIIFAVDVLEYQIRKLQKHFGKVLVNMVSGNHGRLQPLKYTKNANRYNNSLEKIVYTFIERNVRKDLDKFVTFNSSPEDVLRYSINGHKFQQEHGDKIKTTGTAIAGPSTSFARAYLKKSNIGVNTNASFKTLIIGHFHNHYYAGGVMVCNSVKGYDSYCAMLGIDFSLPGCTSFAVNSHGQIIYLTDLQIRQGNVPKPTKSIEIF